MEFAHKLFSTRGGTLALAGVAALIAAVAVFAYVKHYRTTVEEGGQAASVLVAPSDVIPKGTAGETIAANHLFQVKSIRESQLREGAITDPASLRGKIAKSDILPQQQLTLADFTAAKQGLSSRLSGVQRAITLSIDAAHGMIGQVAAGDRVDVYAGFNVNPVDALGRPIGSGQARPVLRLIMQNITVLDVAKARKAGSSADSQVTLKTTAYQAQNLAFTSDNGKVWLVLRPPTGAKASKPNLVTVETLLLGVSPVAGLRSLGGKS